MSNLNGYKVATFTDFGDPSRRVVVGRHKTFATAGRRYASIWEIYGRGRRGWKVWQEVITENTTQTR